uniref:oleoyl-[acyl-carrier-protein] hydrolase n=1 Tax=Timema genevievae TaxID=629358 RepID=A0A7R9PIV1_TIMGE|nr:unnamed protein product [Timema genevievae]
MNPNDSIAQHISMIESMALSLANAREAVSYMNKITKTLESLPSSFSAFINVWYSYAEEIKAFENLTSRLLREEKWLMQNDDVTTAFAVLNVQKSYKNMKSQASHNDEKKENHGKLSGVKMFLCVGLPSRVASFAGAFFEENWASPACDVTNDATSLHNLDVASRSLDSLSHFVSLINSSADINESRFKAGLPILDVQWAHNKKPESIRPVIRSLDQLLGKNTPTYVYMYVQDELIKDAKEGPYNLVGVSWGGILALELARELQSQDQKIQLFLLDGAPDTTQSIAKLLGTGDELQCNIITKLLGIESNKVTLIAKCIAQLSSMRFTISNIPGKESAVAAGLSRLFKESTLKGVSKLTHLLVFLGLVPEVFTGIAQSQR